MVVNVKDTPIYPFLTLFCQSNANRAGRTAWNTAEPRNRTPCPGGDRARLIRAGPGELMTRGVEHCIARQMRESGGPRTTRLGAPVVHLKPVHSK